MYEVRGAGKRKPSQVKSSQVPSMELSYIAPPSPWGAAPPGCEATGRHVLILLFALRAQRKNMLP
jgi:hypothetical protein